VRKNIRDMLVFSEQDVIKDPPFSRLDLISCRNLLIYMGGELQRKLIPIFHYALNPGGYLFLGTSETVGEHGELFATLERKWKVYQRKPDAHGMPRLALSAASMPPTVEERALPAAVGRVIAAGKLSLRELTEQAVLQQVAPVAALVNGNGDIYYLHGRSGLYLEPTPGEASVNNILKMAREGLRRDLATALHKASAGQAVVRSPGLRVKTNGDYAAVDLTIAPMADGPAAGGEALLYLVMLRPRPPDELLPIQPAIPAAAEAADHPDGDAQLRVAALQQELQAKDEYLQTTIEELETTNEELKSSNEEMQSVNEELQSTNEELETSKEELQSVNEELATVNAELQAKVADLSRANNDMNNLLAGTGIATVFVDHGLRIMRFTPAATRIINLIQSDIGRPVGHIVSNLAGYDHLLVDVRGVLDTLIPKETEVQTKSGAWYTMRIQPYRTLDNVIEGAVLTFVEISLVKQTQEALQRSEALLRATLRLSQAGGWEWDVRKQTMFWTAETYRLHDLEPTEFAPGAPEHIARSLACYRPADRPVIQAAFQQCAENGQPYDLELPFTTVKGRQLRVRTRAEAIWENGQVVRVIGTLVDVTDRPPRGRADSRPETTPAADPGA
jgi:two-component system CheB/CheR fusion protein